jgi:hypothetical protein
MEDKLKTLISLAFPSMMAPKKESVDYNRMSDEEYYASPHFQGQGRLAESHPIASVVGPVKGFNLLRKWLLNQAAKPKPTTAPLALTGPPDLPRLTYNPTGPYDQIIAEDLDPLIDDGLFPADEPEFGLEDATPDEYEAGMEYTEDELIQMGDDTIEGDFDERPYPITPRTAPGGVPTDLTRQNAWALEEQRRDDHADREFRAQNPYHRDYGDMSEIEEHGIIGSFPQLQGGPRTFYSRPQEGTLVNRIHDVNPGDEDYYSYTQDQIVMGPRGSETIDRPTQVGFTPEYGIPKGYYSALSKVLAGDTLNKAEKESATREIKYRQMAYDRKLFDSVINDPTRNIYDEMTADEHGNIVASPVPSLTDHTALRAWMEERPLEFTTRTGRDTLTQGNDSVSTLHFGGGNEQGVVHFTTNEGVHAQAFVTYNADGDVFNVLEAQSEMRGEGNPYMQQAIPKLAQQTILDWADTDLDTISIPTGRALFEKYYSIQGAGLWGDEAKLLELKDSDEFDTKAANFYNEPILQKEVEKTVLKHIDELANDPYAEGMGGTVGYDEVLEKRFGKEYANAISDLESGKENNIQNAIGLQTLHRAKRLKGLRSNYQGKVKHYNEYLKQVKKAAKQHGAEFKDDGNLIKVTNPEATKRKIKKEGFTMAMLLKGITDRQVA